MSALWLFAVPMAVEVLFLASVLWVAASESRTARAVRWIEPYRGRRHS